MKTEEKSSMINTSNLKSDALNAASTMGGFMAANVIAQVVPLENALIKSAIPLALGLGVTLLTKNSIAKAAAYGAMAHGTLSIVKATLMGDNPVGARTAGNPIVKKILDYVVPEGLGSVENGDYSIHYDPYIDVTEDYEEPLALEGLNEDAFSLNGLNEGAFSLGYANDSYEQQGAY